MDLISQILNFFLKQAGDIIFLIRLNKLLIKMPLLRPYICKQELIRGGVGFDATQFVACAAGGQLTEVKLFTYAGFRVNVPASNGNTALIMAASHGHKEVVSHLLGVPETDVNTKNDAGDTALIVAARQGNAEVVNCLLAYQKERDEFFSDSGDTARSKAIQKKRRRIVSRLRKQKDLNVNAQNQARETALLEAARREHREIVHQLQDAGAREPELEKKVARWQLDQEGILTKNHFVRAAAGGEIKLAGKYLQAGMDVNSLDDRSETALIVAVRHRQIDMVKFLLAQEGKTNVNLPNPDGVRAIEIAAARNYQELVEILRKADANIDLESVARRRLQETGLQFRVDVFIAQAAKGDEKLVALFLDGGMKADAEDEHGDTALMEAAKNGQKQVVELLIARGANVNQTNRFKVSVLEVAEGSGQTEISELLRNREAKATDAFKQNLLDAIEKGSREGIEAALNRGITPDTYSESGEPILITAVRQKNPGIVDLLLTRKASVDVKDRDHRTALMWAAELGLTDMIHSLLHAHAHLEETDSQGNTPLLQAISNGQAKAVQLLIRAGANVDVQDRNGRTVQMIATYKGHPEIIKLLKATGRGANNLEAQLLAAATRGDSTEVKTLLDADANPEIPDDAGNTPLALAAARGWTEVIKALNPNQRLLEKANRNGDTPLMQAARGGHLSTVKLLLKGKEDTSPDTDGTEIHTEANNRQSHLVNINATNKREETALLQAAIAGRGEVVEYLANEGANPNLAASATTPLLESCFHGQLSAVKALLDHGADINQQLEYGFSPLMTAMLAGHGHIEKVLRDRNIKLGDLEGQVFVNTLDGNAEGLMKLDLNAIDLNARDRNGWTALMIASREGFDSIAKILMDHNVRTNIRSRDGQTTALLEAASNGRTGVLTLLIPKTGSDATIVTNALIEAAANGHAEAVRLLATAAHASIDGRPKGRVPLIEAATRGHLQVVQVLLELGADKQKKSRDELTAIMAAQLHMHDKIVELMVESGLQEGLKDASLLLAASQGKHGEVRRLLSLLDPPDINARDEEGRTALMRACEMGHQAVVRVLLAYMNVPERQAAASDHDYRKRTPLMFASRGGSVQIVQSLLDLHVDIHAESSDGRTALMEGCKWGRFEIVKSLFQVMDDDSRRVAVNHQDANGNTPLSEALLPETRYLEEYYREIVRLLEMYGAVLGRDSAEFLHAVREGNLKRVEELISRVDFKKLRLHGKTPLMICTDKGYYDVTKFLIEKGVDVNETDSQGVTALMLAVTSNHRDILKLLLVKGADCDRLDSKKSNALIKAVQREDQDMVGDLLAAEAGPNHRDSAGNTALIAAVNKNHPQLVKLLLDNERRPNLDGRDNDRRTALTLAHLRGSCTHISEMNLPAFGEPIPNTLLQQLTEIEGLLLNAGAREGWNESELIHSVRNNDAHYVQDLVVEGVDVNSRDIPGNTPLLIACQNDNLRLSEILIKYGAGVNVRNRDDRTPLMEAARQEKNGVDLVKRLYKADPNLDLNAQDRQGETALLEAARAGEVDTLQFLVEVGANVNVANRRGEAPIIEMAKYPHVAPIANLLKHGANTCAHDADHDTSILEAAKRGHLKILELLLEHLQDRLRYERLKRETIINAIDDQSRTAVDWAERAGYKDCVKLLRLHGGKSVYDTDFIVFTSPHGSHYHLMKCRSIRAAKEKERLKKRLLRDAIRLHYEFCEVCKPNLAPIDWTC